MAAVQHLRRAPIVEAMLNFQADASQHWNDAPPLIRNAWPTHSLVQEMRQVQLQLPASPTQPPEQSLFTRHAGMLLRSPSDPTVHQARPDGYTFSRLAPYENWESFEAAAMSGWETFSRLLAPEPLHAVMARFINRLEFPTLDFRLSRYFTAPPQPPPHLNWAFHGFTQHLIYAVPDSFCTVQSIFTPAFSGHPDEKHAFVLDIQVMLKEALPASGLQLTDVFREMRRLKNEAFFGVLTDETIGPYI